MNYQDLLQISLSSFRACAPSMEMLKFFTEMGEISLQKDRKDDFSLKFIIIKKEWLEGKIL